MTMDDQDPRCIVRVHTSGLEVTGIWPGWDRAMALVLMTGRTPQDIMIPATEEVGAILTEMRTSGGTEPTRRLDQALAHYQLNDSIMSPQAHAVARDYPDGLELYHMWEDVVLHILDREPVHRFSPYIVSASLLGEGRRRRYREVLEHPSRVTYSC